VTDPELSRRHVLSALGGGAIAPVATAGISSANRADGADHGDGGGRANRSARTDRADRTHRAPRADPGEPVAFQYFHEDWRTITDDLSRVAERGYDAIWIQQPARASLDWSDQDGRNDPPLGYQPVDLRTFDGALGTESELRELIDTAHEHGLAVYVDTVMNHMAAGRDPKYEFPQFGYEDFHHPDDPDEETKELLGLPDLEQESAYVRGELRAYVEKIAALGADGYRFDAVKHIPASFFAEYANQWADDLGMFRVGEILNGSTSYVQEYVDQGPGMHAFDYPLHFVVDEVFDGGDMTRLEDAGLFSQDPGHAMPFVENHDVDGPSQYKLAHALVLTIEGYPVVYNRYPDWVLEEDDVTEMVWVKSNLAGGPMRWRHADADVVVYERETNLLVALNNATASRTVEVATSWQNQTLADYAGNVSDVTTDGDGRVTLTVPAEGWTFYAPPGQDGSDASPPSASFSHAPSSPTAGETVSFDASASSDPDGDIASYAWDMNGDGTTDAAGVQASFTFESAGSYAVTLTVSDADDSTAADVATRTVDVAPEPGVVERYDADGDGCIDVAELNAGLDDYDDDELARDELDELLDAYFECL